MSVVDFDEALKRYDPVLGIEVHVELGTKSKMFDDAPAHVEGEPNTALTPSSLGLPGTLPTVNKTAVEYAILIGLALNCSISTSCRFARKNYFYPDVPKNFQTSQSDEPIAFDGYLDVELDDGETVRVEIERAHIEEDAGKNVHVGGRDGRIHGASYSLVDYNRAGIPLVEIVTRPITGVGERAPEVARAYVKTLRDIFRAIGVSPARMERGNVRADINLSLRPDPQGPMGTRTETKNVNSFRSIERAVRYEISRQAAVLDAGEEVLQETRHYHDDTASTSSGRPKTDAEDYRYFHEPDLLPLTPDPAWVEELRAQLPEMPAARRRRLQQEWGYSDLEMRDVINADAIDVIEATIGAGTTPAAARKWWMGELLRISNDRGEALAELTTPQTVVELQGLIDAGRINDQLARQVLEGVLAGEGTPEEVVTSRGLEIVSDEGPLLEIIDQTLADQPDIADKIRGGDMKPIGAVIGAVMKATRGQADAGRVRELIMERVNA